MASNYNAQTRNVGAFINPSEGFFPILYAIQDDGSVTDADGSGSDSGKTVFFGYTLDQYGGVPHGPLYLRYWTLTTTNTTKSYTPTGSAITYYVNVRTQDLTGPTTVACTPSLFVDSSGNGYASLYSFTLPSVTIDPHTNKYPTEVEFITVASDNANYGLWTLFTQSFPDAFASGVAFGYFPAFDDSGNYYSRFLSTSVIGGVTTTVNYATPAGPYFNVPGYPYAEYAPIGNGFKLTTQTSSERVWTRHNTDGTTDTITIQLYTDYADGDLDLSDLLSAFYLAWIPVGQGYICQGETFTFNPMQVEQDTYNPTTHVVSVLYDSPEVSGQMLVVHADGSWGIASATIAGATGVPPTSSAPTTTLSSGSDIILNAGLWDGPFLVSGDGNAVLCGLAN